MEVAEGSRDGRSSVLSSEDTALTDGIALDFLLGAQRPMITIRHPEEDGDGYGILEDEG